MPPHAQNHYRQMCPLVPLIASAVSSRVKNLKMNWFFKVSHFNYNQGLNIQLVVNFLTWRYTVREPHLKSVKEACTVSRSSKCSMVERRSVFVHTVKNAWPGNSGSVAHLATRYVTLCSNGVLQVYKGNQSKSGCRSRNQLDDFTLQTKIKPGPTFTCRPKKIIRFTNIHWHRYVK